MTEKPKNITIVGAGMWGTALGVLASHHHHHVRLWSRRCPENLASVIVDADVILSAVSMGGVTPIIKQLQDLNLPKKAIIVTATKGLDPATTLTPSRLWQSAFPDYPVVVLSGPNLSKEIQQNLPAATAVASTDLTAAETIQVIFATEKFRVYVNSDPLGTELGGTLKM